MCFNRTICLTQDPSNTSHISKVYKKVNRAGVIVQMYSQGSNENAKVKVINGFASIILSQMAEERSKSGRTVGREEQ